MIIENRAVIENIPWNTVGIYGIRSILRDKWYIGQSKDVRKRLRDHLYMLRKNRHHNPHLQAHFNKYGETDFQVRLFIKCDKDTLNYYETSLIEGYDSYENGFNQVPLGESTATIEDTYIGFYTGEFYTKKNVLKMTDSLNTNYSKIEEDLFKKGMIKVPVNLALLETPPKLKKLRNPFGKIIEFYFYEGLKPYFGLNPDLVKLLLDGRMNHYKRWTRWDDDIKNYDTHSKLCKIIDPTGKVIEFFYNKDIEKISGISCSTVHCIKKGLIKQHLGWRPYKEEYVGVPATNCEPVIYKFVSPDLKVHETLNLSKLCQDNNLEIRNLSSVWHGKRNSCCGWMKYEEGKTYSKTNEVIFFSPTGEETKVSGLRGFSVKNNLNYNSVVQMVYGKMKSHKGWVIDKQLTV